MRKPKLATELKRTSKRILRRGIQASLFALIVFYGVAMFVNRELGLATSLAWPLGLTSLLFIISILEGVEDRLPEDGAPKVTVYTDSTSFYEATREAIENARRRVWVTYPGPIGPGERSVAFQRHLGACQEWARRSDKRSFRRIMTNVRSASMAEYIQQEIVEMMLSRAEQRHNYTIRVLGDTDSDVGGIGIGIYDDDLVFLSYVSGSDRMVGIGIRGREIVRDCFEHYYEHLWASSASDIDKLSIGPGAESAAGRELRNGVRDGRRPAVAGATPEDVPGR
jgi:hypothetical protein